MAVPAGCELRVRVVRRCLVKAAASESEHLKNHHQPPLADDNVTTTIITVSNLDLIPNTYQASVMCIYPKPPTSAAGDFDAVVAAFEAGLPSLLRHFFPLTGRIVANPCSGLPEVHCRNQGAELVVAHADVPLRSVDFSHAEKPLKRILLPYAEDIPLSVQLVSFACGGFAVTWANNNLVLDGNSATRLVRTWSELARTGTIAAVGCPSYDRSVFRARHPPSYSAAVDEMFVPYDDRHLVNVLTAKDSFVERLYYVEAEDIARLQEMATSTGPGGKQQRASRVQAVSAYLWKRLAAVVGASQRVSSSSAAASCCMGYRVDGRWRVTSPALREAMKNYVGNVTPYVLAEAAVEEIQRKSLTDVAAMVREAIASVDYDERIQELVDWVEEHKETLAVAGCCGVVEKAIVGLGSPTINQTVWASFPLDTDFGFGHAALAMPTWESEGLCTGNLVVTTHPGGNGSWLVSAYLWPSLIRALESDEQDLRIFKPLTAERLGV